MRPMVVIPARMASTRLPGKPLADIHGRPMIAWVVAAALEADLGPVCVAAAEAEVADAARSAGAQVVMTDPDLPSGSDRVRAALAALDPEGRHDVAVNLQGDMPTFPPTLLRVCAAALAASPDAGLSTLVSPSENPGERADPNLVKAIVSWPDTTAPGPDSVGRCLYFTRADAPSGPGPVMRHVGLYAWRRAALDRFVAAPPSPLEVRESLEQLRALELGLSIAAGFSAVFPKGVDTPDHLAAARADLASTAS